MRTPQFQGAHHAICKNPFKCSLVFGSFYVQAETQTNVKDNPSAVAPSPDMQVADLNDTSATAQINAKAPAGRSQPKVSAQHRSYEIPLSDYNNGGHFGN